MTDTSPQNAPAADAALSHPSVTRNREPILAELKEHLPRTGTVLEVASGTGEHAAYFAAAITPQPWLPSDPDPRNRESIAAWAARTPEAEIQPPLDLDARAPHWAVEDDPPTPPVSAIVAINLIHIAPWSACLGLMAGAGRILPSGGILFLYGAYKIDGAHTAPSNEQFDQWLKDQNPEWGIRDVGDVAEAAEREGLHLTARTAMPANNFVLVFTRE